jgi:Glucodextranase, domain B
MTMLDDRGREAARAIQDSVSAYRPVVAAVALLARRKAIWQGAQLAAGAVAVAALIAAVALVTDPDDHDVAETTTIPERAVTTTVPSPPTTDAPESPSVPATTVATSPTITVPPTTIADTTPPTLSIISPEPEAHVETEVVTFRGTTEPGASVVAASKFDADVDAAGNWSIDLVLAPGKNAASFTATDAAGNQARASIVVWFDVSEEPKEVPVEDFTAYATFGSCSETPPYDV